MLTSGARLGHMTKFVRCLVVAIVETRLFWGTATHCQAVPAWKILHVGVARSEFYSDAKLAKSVSVLV